MDSVAALAHAIGYDFKSPLLALRAMTHSGELNEPSGKGLESNVRLAFLGDAVLRLCIRERLLDDDAAGTDVLTPRSDLLLSKEALARIAEKKLPPPRFGMNIPPTGSRVYSEYLEAVLGAVYEEAGLIAAKKVLNRLLPELR